MFQKCTALESIVIPQKVTVVGSYAFLGSGLKSISLPSSIKYVYDGVFSNCVVLTEVTLGAENLTISANAFQGDTNLIKLTFESAPIAGITRGAIPNNAALKVYVPDAPSAKQVRDSGISPEKIFIGEQPSGLEPSEFTVDGIVYWVILSSTGEDKVSVVSHTAEAL